MLKFVFNGLKKHLHDLYMRFDCIKPEFPHLETLKKILENPDRPTQFLNFGRVRATYNFFFFCLMRVYCISIQKICAD